MIHKNLFATIALLFISQVGVVAAPVGIDGLKAGFERKLREVLQPLVERHVKALANLEQAEKISAVRAALSVDDW